MAIVHFTSSDSFMEQDAAAVEHAEIAVLEYVEGTYDMLRHGAGTGSGEVIAHFVNGAWELMDGRRFSDWAVKV